MLGEALEGLPGPKTIVFLGWGLGQLTPVGVRMGEGYEDAARALLSADAAVFTLDVTEADSHTLEVGLQELAERTGGFYARTHVSAPGAMNRLRGALAGHYLLSFERPAAKPGAGGRLEVRLRGARGEVLAPAQIPMPAP